jgi:hypothetical protein
MSWYDVHDGWTTSPVERVRNEYKKVIRDVEDAVQAIRADIASLNTSVATDVPKYYGSTVGDTSSGLVVTDFEAAVTRWKTSVNGLTGPWGALTQAVNDLEAKLTLLRARKAVLERMCVTEDTLEEEYTYADIPF